MLKKSHKDLQMSAVELTNDTRRAAYALVDREYRATQSWEVALQNIASMVGTSPSWLEKFISRRPEVKEPRLTLFANIREAYNTYCVRVETENRADEQANARLREKLNAASESLTTQAVAQDRGRVSPMENAR